MNATKAAAAAPTSGTDQSAINNPILKPGVSTETRMTRPTELSKNQATIPGPELARQQIEIKHGEAKGSYQIHPVACLFPLLTGQPFDELKKSIDTQGQQDPIVIEGHTVLDGRNRLMVMNELGRAPKIVQFSDVETSLTACDWIIAKNLSRRNLTDDQRLAIATKYQLWVRLEQARPTATARPVPPAGRSDTANDDDVETNASHSQVADNPNGSEFPQESAENVGKSKKGRPRGGRSDAEAVAANTKLSRYKSEQMLKLQKLAPALFKAVESGQLSLKKAMCQLREQHSTKTARPKRRNKGHGNAVEKAKQKLTRLASKLDVEELADFWINVAHFAADQSEANKPPT